MKTDQQAHWQDVYQTKQTDAVSWYAPHLQVSLELLKQAGLNAQSSVIDIGAGASTLVDDLLDAGLSNITAVDISAAALAVAQQRLGVRAEQVQWLVADAARMSLPALHYDLWHDRAALHFLVEPADAAAYVVIASRSIKSGGYAVIAGIASDGPEQCSRLNVARREPADIAILFGAAFTLIDTRHELHTTPWGSQQSFAYALLRKE